MRSGEMMLTAGNLARAARVPERQNDLWAGPDLTGAVTFSRRERVLTAS